MASLLAPRDADYVFNSPSETGVSYAEVLARGLKVADATAISLCADNELPIIVFNLLVVGNIARAVQGERIGTLISLEN